MTLPPIGRPKRAGRLSDPLLPPVIGHRGAAGRAPENTLAGLHCAKQLGCRWVEFDARVTADGVAVLCHDPMLDRTTDGTGLISALPFTAVRECDAGIRFGPGFAGERVPTLEEALLLCAELNLGANIELKPDKGRDYALAKTVAETLDRLRGLIGPVLISSFHPAVLHVLFGDPEPPLGILFRMVMRGWVELAERFDCVLIGADHRRLRPRRVAEIRAAGYQLAAFTVNDPARARALYDWGVTSVFSDVPDMIINASESHVAALPRRGSIR